MQVVKCLPSKHKDLSLSSSTAKISFLMASHEPQKKVKWLKMVLEFVHVKLTWKKSLSSYAPVLPTFGCAVPSSYIIISSLHLHSKPWSYFKT
jgi:hypothetical protein